MAKDPAINWYFDNWSGGTKGFSRHQKGCYMDLLEAQFYLGHLSLEQVKNILGPDFNQWNFLINKFIKDEQGKYFNERMELEKEKRRQYSESRKNGKAGRKKSSENHVINHMNNHEEIIPETGIGTKTEEKGGMGEKEESNHELLIPSMVAEFKIHNPNAYIRPSDDFETILSIAEKIKEWLKLEGDFTLPAISEKIKLRWGELVKHISADDFLKKYSLSQINKHFSSIVQSFNNKDNASSNNNRTYRQGDSHRPVITGTAEGAGTI